MHCQPRQLQAVVRQLQECWGQAAGGSGEAFKGFPEQLKELAAGRLGMEPQSPGAALRLLTPHVEGGLLNAARGLLRARGADQHPVPEGKPARVLRELERQLRAAQQTVKDEFDAKQSESDAGEGFCTPRCWSEAACSTASAASGF